MKNLKDPFTTYIRNGQMPFILFMKLTVLLIIKKKYFLQWILLAIQYTLYMLVKFHVKDNADVEQKCNTHSLAHFFANFVKQTFSIC